MAAAIAIMSEHDRLELVADRLRVRYYQARQFAQPTPQEWKSLLDFLLLSAEMLRPN